MHNTVKHARGTAITVRLAASDQVLALDVIDDGRGFDAAAEFPGHLGLVSMRERVDRFGGQVTIDSEPGGGTRVHVEVPLRSSRLSR
jgi:signal transduction histidine kinase